MTCVLIIASYADSLINFRGPLIADLIKVGCTVHVAAPELTPGTAAHEALVRLGAQVHDIRLQRTGLNPVADIATLMSLLRVIRKCAPDVTLSYTIKPVIWGLLAGTLARVPQRFALITGLGYAFTGQARGKRRFVQMLARALYRIGLGRAHKVFFQNPDDAELFKTLGLLPARIPAVVVDGSGVDMGQFQRAPLTDLPIRFLMIARLIGDKGVREYVAAAKQIKSKYPACMFHLVGSLDSNPNAILQTELDSWVADGAIIYHGAQSDVRPFLTDCHVYVLPSYREGTPRTVLEAMAIGRAVITTDAPGCRETVTSGDNGLLVPVQDVQAISDAMTCFIDNPELIATMGAASYQRVVDKYDVRKVNAQMIGEMGLAK